MPRRVEEATQRGQRWFGGAGEDETHSDSLGSASVRAPSRLSTRVQLTPMLQTYIIATTYYCYWVGSHRFRDAAIDDEVEYTVLFRTPQEV